MRHKNRRVNGIKYFLELLGKTSDNGFGIYKTINVEKTVFIKIN